MADYDLAELLRQARNGTLADNHPGLQTLRRHADQGARGAAVALAEVTDARTDSGGGDVHKFI
jgi:hypothetical protein